MNSVNKNTIFNTIKTLFGIIYPLITFPYISRILLTENVGKINFGNSIVSYFSLVASLGVATYAIRECSRIRNNKEELSKTASQIFSINIISTVVAYIALFITFVFARNLDNYRILIVIQSSTLIFTTLGADWINSAMEDFKFIAIRTVLMQLVSLILMFVFVRATDDYLIYALISVVASSGANIVNIFYRKKYCSIKFTFDIDWKRHLKPIMLLFSLLLAQTIYCNLDMTMIGFMKGDKDVGLYSTSVKIYNLVNSVVASISCVVMPQLAYNFSKKNYDEINRLARYSLNFIVILGLPSLVGLNVITSEIIGSFAGEAFLGATTSLHILTLSLACSFIAGWCQSTLLSARRDNVCLQVAIFSALLNMILNFLLIPIYGINGAAFTTFLAELAAMTTQYFKLDKKIKISNLGKMLKGPVLGSLSIIAIAIIVKLFFTNSFIVMFLTIILSVISYASILYLVKDELFLSFFIPIKNKLLRRK